MTRSNEWRYDRAQRAVRDHDGQTIAQLAAADTPKDVIGPLLAAAPALRDALQGLVDALTDAEPDRKLTDQVIIVEAIAKAGRALIKSERG